MTWFTDSSVHWFIGSLAHWLFIQSLLRCFIGFLIHWFTDILFHPFIGSSIHWFTHSVVQGFFHVIFSLAPQPPFTSFADAPDNFIRSCLLHLKNVPIGRWLLIVMLYVRNFRPGACRALPGTCVCVCVCTYRHTHTHTHTHHTDICKC